MLASSYLLSPRVLSPRESAQKTADVQKAVFKGYTVIVKYLKAGATV